MRHDCIDKILRVTCGGVRPAALVGAQIYGTGDASGVAQLAGSRTASTTCRIAAMTSSGCSAWM